MQKKPGQISANTLNLRFMQNAAKAKQEKEVEAAKAKVKSQEEWELSESQSVMQGWSIPDRVTEEQGTVTYEQSYLPFLFPGFSGAHGAAVARAGTSNHAKPSKDDDSDREGAPQIPIKGRRTFGKHGKEEIIGESPSEPSQPPSSTGEAPSLHRGTRAISSYGRAAASLSDTSGQRKSRPTPPPAKRPAPKTIAPKASEVQGPPVFMKPQIDDPRTESGVRKKRSPTDVGDKEDGQRKKKKKRQDQDV